MITKLSDKVPFFTLGQTPMSTEVVQAVSGALKQLHQQAVYKQGKDRFIFFLAFGPASFFYESSPPPASNQWISASIS